MAKFHTVLEVAPHSYGPGAPADVRQRAMFPKSLLVMWVKVCIAVLVLKWHLL